MSERIFNKKLVIPALLMAAAAAAETPDAPGRSATLAPLIVTAEAPQAAAAVSTVDAAALGGEQGLTLSSSLQRVPGVVVQNDYNASQGMRLAVRGFGSRANFGVRGLQIRLDGVPLTLPDGQAELDAIDTELVEFVDVLRGPSATLFGNAAGGAVLVETREASGERRLRTDLAVGEAGFRKLRMEAAGNVLGAATLGAVNLTRLNGFRDHAASDSKLITGKLDVPIARGELKFSTTITDISSDDPGGLNAAQVVGNRDQAAPRNLQFDAGESIRQQRLAAHWLTNLAGADVKTTAWLGQRDFANRLPFQNGGRVTFDRQFAGLGVRAGKALSWLGLQHSLNVAVDSQLQRDSRRRFNNVSTAAGSEQGAETLSQRERGRTVGLSLQNRTRWGAGWSASVGARRDDVRLRVDDRFLSDGDDSGRRNLSHNSFSAGLAKSLPEDTLVYLRVASSFATPTFTELANPNGGGLNADLQPAEAINYELGLSGQGESLEWSASVYSIRLENELIPFELDNQPGRSFFANAGQSRRNGVELAGAWRFNRWLVSGAYSWNDYKFRDYVVDGENLSGNQIPGTPSQQLFAELAYRSDRYTARINWQAQDKTWANDRNTVRVAGHAVVNVRLSAAACWGQWQLTPTLSLNNIFDEQYNDNLRLNAFGGRHFEPAPGFNVFASLTAEL